VTRTINVSIDDMTSQAHQ